MSMVDDFVNFFCALGLHDYDEDGYCKRPGCDARRGD